MRLDEGPLELDITPVQSIMDHTGTSAIQVRLLTLSTANVSLSSSRSCKHRPSAQLNTSPGLKPSSFPVPDTCPSAHQRTSSSFAAICTLSNAELSSHTRTTTLDFLTRRHRSSSFLRTVVRWVQFLYVVVLFLMTLCLDRGPTPPVCTGPTYA
jgi:hypothetical protein